MQGIPYNSSGRLREQTMALVGLRWAVWRRKLSSENKWGRILFIVLGSLGGLAITGAGVAGAYGIGRLLESSPELVGQWGGAMAMLGLIFAGMIAARLYFSILSVATGQPFLQPRRFLVYAVPPQLITAINCIAQLFEPAWMIFYAPAVMLAHVYSKVPGGPAMPATLFALLLMFLCSAAILQAITALIAELFAHKKWRRLLVIALMFGGWGLAISLSRISETHSRVTPANLWKIVQHLPPGWAARLASALTHGELLQSIWLIAILLATGFIAAVIGLRLSLREARRPPETTVTAPADRSGPAGWRFPFLSGPLSALAEKEVKTIFRAMWLQMIAGPVGFLVMRFLLMQGHTEHGKADGPFLGPQPLLMGAFYAHLGVLAWSVNVFGVDGQATRGIFLWPLRGRTVLAAKNAVAYLVSLLIFLLLAFISRLVAPLSAEQFVVGLCAHAATFPVLAVLGNATSIYFPAPMRGGRMIRQPGGATAIARIGALALLALTGWAPYAIAKLLGMPLVPAYLGELLAMSIAYGGLLSFSEQLLENRREPLLHALSKEE